MPPSFVILDRVVWGVSAILGKLGVHNPWRAMLLEYRTDAPPATELGAAEAAWRGASEPRCGVADLPSAAMADTKRYAVNGIELDVIEAGDPADPGRRAVPRLPGERPLVAPPDRAAGRRRATTCWRPTSAATPARARRADVAAYGVEHLGGDLLGLLDATGHDDAVFVGHDWGALLVWDLARLHPERVRAVVNVSVPYTEWPAPPTDVFKAASGDRFFYILYFQDVGPAERELEADVERTMRTVLWGASGDAFVDDPPPPPPAEGTGFLDVIAGRGEVPAELPSWLTDDDLAAYVDAFEASGFFGPISWYRNLDHNHALVKDRPAPAMPVWFIGGTRDGVIAYRPGYVEAMEQRLPTTAARRSSTAPATGRSRRRRRRSTGHCWRRWRSWTDQPPRRLAERPHDRPAPPEPGDHVAGRPRPVAAVRPPLERVEVVGARLDDLCEAVTASARHPDEHADERAAEHPAAVEDRVQRAEPAALPHVDVLVVGHEAAPAGRRCGLRAGTVDGVADRDEEAAPEAEPAVVDVTVRPAR